MTTVTVDQCPRCGSSNLALIWMEQGPHWAKLVCRDCEEARGSGYIKWIKRDEAQEGTREEKPEMPRSFSNVSKSEFVPAECEDGAYTAEIIKVDEGTFHDPNGNALDKYMVDWTLEGTDDGQGYQVELRQFINIPDGLVNEGRLNDNSNLYKFLKAIGEPVDAESFDIDPERWVGRKAQVVVVNKTAKTGNSAGKARPVIDNVLKLQTREASAGGKKPARAAAAGASNGKPADSDDF